MSELYETFVMEIRPRLQSCNVFFILKQNLNEKISVRLKENEINIVNNETIDSIKIDSFNILINSLSCLQVSNTFISFRFQTQNLNKTNGLFKSEFLMYNVNNSNSVHSNTNQIEKNIDYTIKCANCKNNLTDIINFERILPLPSENIDTHDFFCHKSDSIPNLKLTPNLNDCFYSNCYMHLNRNVFKNYNLTTNSILICKRCFSWLGLHLSKSDAFQIWFNTIILESNNSSITSNAFSDFTLSVKLEFKELLFSACKILFECCNLNTNEYLCVWVLEKNLEVFIKGEKYKNGNSGSKRVAKVLFYFSSTVDGTVNEWLNDSVVSNIKISKPMMLKGLNHLYDMCKLIPNCFRTSNNFYVSYIVL